MQILAIDPGTTHSAWMLFADGKPKTFDDEAENVEILSLIAAFDVPVVYEMIASQGMAVGKETFETVWWIGRFVQVAEHCNLPSHRIYRREEKLHLCGVDRAKDGNVRQALIDLYGGESVAIGNKKCKRCKGKGTIGRKKIGCDICAGSGWQHPPGPLKGIASHSWSALAVARTWWDTKRQQ